MSGSSKKSLKPTERNQSKAIDRPFDPAIWREAKEIAQRYRMVIEFEDGDYYGTGVELPGVMADGPTPAACHKATTEAMTVMVAYLLEQGEEPPAPASESEEMRSEQVNVRLTPSEKMRLERRAKRAGFRGLSDYVRTKALGGAD